MKFNISLHSSQVYNEVGQRNPLRWRLLYMKADGSFVDQSNWMKCKDFFNDVVAFMHDHKFGIYGFDTKLLKKNSDGFYLLLKYVNDRESFIENMKVVNEQLYADLGCIVSIWPRDEEKDECLIHIPDAAWETTYRISLLTFCIRLSNYGYKYTKWDDLWTAQAPCRTMESAFTAGAITNAKKYGFKVPPAFEKYWYYMGELHNSEKGPKTPSYLLIHNNGCSNWALYMEKVA